MSLTKIGSKKATIGIAGSNYTGGTYLEAGTLVLGVTDALPTDQNVYITGGTLDLGGNSQTLSVANNLVPTGGTIQNGTLNLGGDVNVHSGSLTVGTGGILNFTAGTMIVGAVAGDSGTLNISGAGSSITNAGGAEFTVGRDAGSNGVVNIGLVHLLPAMAACGAVGTEMPR